MSNGLSKKCSSSPPHARSPRLRAKQNSAAPSSNAYTEQERAAIQAERTTEVKKPEPEPQSQSAEMLIKRSVSPDGRIDSVSIEFTTTVGGMTAQRIKSHARRMLALQNEIVGGYLKSTAKPQAKTNGASPARLISWHSEPRHPLWRFLQASEQVVPAV